jgi:hypothetical protein
VIGYARSFELNLSDDITDYNAFYEVTALFRNKMGDMGETSMNHLRLLAILHIINTPFTTGVGLLPLI